jgi:hypothetical protein
MSSLIAAGSSAVRTTCPTSTSLICLTDSSLYPRPLVTGMFQDLGADTHASCIMSRLLVCINGDVTHDSARCPGQA